MTPGRLAGLCIFLTGLSGWRLRGTALALGILGALALPPFHMIFLLPPALAGFVWLAWAASDARRAFFRGWWFGAGHCGAGFFWIANSLLVNPEKHAWLIPFAVIGFASVLGLFPALAALALNILRRRLGIAGDRAPGAAGVLAAAALWAVFEWMRGWIFTGLPWNLLASIWIFSDAMVQSAAVIGVFGLGLLTFLAVALFFEGVRAAMAGWLVLAALYGFGAYRLSDAHITYADGVHLRLVQPNIRQADKWRRDLRARHIQRQLEMSAQPPEPGRPPPTHIIWAETAAPYILNRQPDMIRALAGAAPRKGVLLTGALRAENAPGGGVRVYNSLFAIEPSGRIADVYDKVHLVPFGEYVPLHDWFDLMKIGIDQGSFQPGSGLRSMAFRGLPPVTPLICYEAIFPGAAVPADGPRPEWLLNVTNDAWFGRSPGPYQHYALVRLRAVEEGLPVVRLANTGISAVIDPWGREAAVLDLGVADVIDTRLPRPAPGLTPFARYGNALPLALILAALSGAVWALRRQEIQ
ncbi:MAG: apolipoprotein N-acyltransferase [Rhodospirillaceae bacterium]